MTARIKSEYCTAIGLRYHPDTTPTPQVTAVAEQLLADEVVKIARRFGVPVVERPELARALKNFEAEQEIPADLFETVAVLLHQLVK